MKVVKVVLCVFITGRGKHIRHSRVLCVDPWLVLGKRKVK